MDGFPTALVLRVAQSVLTASLASTVSLHMVAPMAATAPPAVLPRRVYGPAHRHGLRTHSTPIRYPHSLQAAAPRSLLSAGLRLLPVG